MSLSNKLLIGTVLILIGCLFLSECRNQSRIDSLVTDIAKYSDSVKYEKLNNGAIIATNQSLKLQSQEQIRALASSLNDTIKEMIKKFKSISNVTYITNKFEAGGDTIRSIVNIPCDFNPFKVRRNSNEYNLTGTVAKNYFSVDSLSILDKQTLVFGRKKISFMKYDYCVDVNHSNPMMTTSNLKDYKYVPRKMWYEKTWVHILTGFVAGSASNTTYNKFLKK